LGNRRRLMMRDRKASQTADLVTAMRALEETRPEHERVCCDHLAKHFINGAYSFLSRSRVVQKITLRYVERKAPGFQSYIAARTRHIDEWLRACVADGVRQVIILGAGNDSRAYRFDQLKAIKVFEVDHPASQKAKMKKVKRILGHLPGHVVYVSVDFIRQRLDDRLFESGYDKELKTLFIWEGVTMYIPAQAVDETLAFIAGNSGEGSSVVFDYVVKSLLDGTCQLEDAKYYDPDYFKRKGEPFIFGLEPTAVEDFLSQRGFSGVNNACDGALKSLYFNGFGGRRRVLRLSGIVTASVSRQKPYDWTALLRFDREPVRQLAAV
jgi:methyltransferase (TIGR00027 family)